MDAAPRKFFRLAARLARAVTREDGAQLGTAQTPLPFEHFCSEPSTNSVTPTRTSLPYPMRWNSAMQFRSSAVNLPCGFNGGSSVNRDSQSLSQPQSRSFFQRAGGNPLANLLGSDRQVTNALIALNVVAYLMMAGDPSIFRDYAQINAYMSMRGEWYRILTASFLHGGPLHLLGNMLTLHWIAPDLERTVGRPCFLLLYGAGALGAGAMHYTMGPMGAALVGASGSIAGLLAGQLVYRFRNRSFIPFGSSEVNWVGQLIAINVMLALFLPGISHWGHAGGMLGGGLAMFLFGPRYAWGNGWIINKPIIPVFKNRERMQ